MGRVGKTSELCSAVPTIEDGGHNLPLISTFYKRLQVTHQSQLLTSPDLCLRQMAEKNLRRYLTLKRSKFRPVMEVMVGDPNFTRKSLSNGTKALVEDDANEMRCDELLSLEKEGQMFRHHTCESGAGLFYSFRKNIGGSSRMGLLPPYPTTRIFNYGRRDKTTSALSVVSDNH